jgi:addiction module RelB/DinJ family antitoxin
MTTTYTFTTGLDQDSICQAGAIFARYGLGLEQALDAFLLRTLAENELPFDLLVPNEATLEALREGARIRKRMISEGHGRFRNVEELLASLKAEE